MPVCSIFWDGSQLGLLCSCANHEACVDPSDVIAAAAALDVRDQFIAAAVLPYDLL